MAKRRYRERSLSTDELKAALSEKLHVVTKAGALRNGNELGHGSIWHLAPGEPWNGRKALCGAAPSIQWATWGEPKVTCPKCQKLAHR